MYSDHTLMMHMANNCSSQQVKLTITLCSGVSLLQAVVSALQWPTAKCRKSQESTMLLTCSKQENGTNKSSMLGRRKRITQWSLGQSYQVRWIGGSTCLMLIAVLGQALLRKALTHIDRNVAMSSGELIPTRLSVLRITRELYLHPVQSCGRRCTSTPHKFAWSALEEITCSQSSSSLKLASRLL